MPDQGALDAMFEADAKTEKKKTANGGQGGGSDSPFTINGYDKSEVVSALQKTIRRGNEVGACYWASELMASNEGYRMWRRLVTIAAEDIGLADPDMVTRIWAMKQAHDFSREWNMPFLAVILLCRSLKNREADDASYLYELKRKQGWKIPMPPEAIDGHTREGRRRLYRAADASGDTWETLWNREFYFDAALLKGYLPDGAGDRFRQALMKHLGLPFRTYDLASCPEPRSLSGQSQAAKDAEIEAISERIPDEVKWRKACDENGEVVDGVFVMQSFTDAGAEYTTDTNAATCTCLAHTKSGGVCKHLLAANRIRRELES